MYANSGTLSYARDQGKNEHTQYIRLAGSLLAIRASTGGAPFQTRYQHTDALGSPVAETSSTGQLIERTEYEPYGGVINRPLRDGPGYTGHVTDASTGLSYMQQRYMDPELGMFLSVDPVTAYQQPMGQFNRYRYGNSNPYKYIDPDGRQSWGITGTSNVGPAVQDACDGSLSCQREAYGELSKAQAAIATAVAPVGLPVRALGTMIRAALGKEVVATGRAALNQARKKNLARFEKRFARDDRNVNVENGKEGSATFTNEVAGRVPGSKAVYEKKVDVAGVTTSVKKTTYDPNGNVVHVKDKIK